MDCKQCLDEIKTNTWLSMKDTPEEIRAHLDHCQSCYSEFHWMVQTREAFAEINQIHIPSNLHLEIMRTLEPEKVSVRTGFWSKWFEYLQWRPALSFVAASVLLVTIATLRLTQLEPVQTMELIQPEDPPTAMRSLTKEEQEAKDTMIMMTAPTAGVTTDSLSELFFEVSSEEFTVWETFFQEKELTYQRVELENEIQIIIEGTGQEIVEMRKELNEALDSAQSLQIHNFLLQNDPKAVKIEEEEATVLNLEMRYRIILLKKLN